MHAFYYCLPCDDLCQKLEATVHNNYNGITFTIIIIQLVPVELQEKWQSDLESIGGQLGGTAERPISSLLIMLETPEEMVVVCTAGQ